MKTSFFVVLFIFASAITSMAQINPQVQLKQNDWVKIVDVRRIKQSAEEFYRATGGGDIPKYMKGKIVEYIEVKIQFLKHCMASKKESPESRSCADDRNTLEDIEKCFEWMDKSGLPGRPEAIDYAYPHYRCDYRAKVFVTYFDSSRDEILTKGEFVVGCERCEIYPGEYATVSIFNIPENTSSWYVWVPK